MCSIKKVLLLLKLILIVVINVVDAQVFTDLNFNQVTNFSLWSSKDNSTIYLNNEDKATVIVLLSPECPMCINYTKLLKHIDKKYAKQLKVIGVIPGKTYSDSSILDFAVSYNLDFPLYTDNTMQLSRFLQGEVTPQVYLFEKNGKLVFYGALDNWLEELGKKRTKADEHYLLDAIELTINGGIVTRTYVKPKGCLLNEY